MFGSRKEHRNKMKFLPCHISQPSSRLEKNHFQTIFLTNSFAFLNRSYLLLYWAVLSCDSIYCAVQRGSNFLSLWIESSRDVQANEGYTAVLSCGAFYKAVKDCSNLFQATEQYFPLLLFCYAVRSGSNFCACRWNLKVWSFKWKLLSSTLQWCCLLCCTRWF